ncbi:MAG: hypothetical protein JSS66_08885 [Armatimonadetes bacterium]|nr:hypothetical protein [Armatimonadota bacterium]
MSALGRLVLCSLTALLSALSFGRDITVTSPVRGAYLGTSNKVNFSIVDATFDVTVNVVATFKNGQNNIKVTVSKVFTPDAANKINDSIDLNFSDTAPQGDWVIVVTPVEKDENGNTLPYIHPNRTIDPVHVDVKAPTFKTFNPIDGSFGKGIIHVVANLSELNVDTWKVQVNNKDIPNNSGNTTLVSVDFDSNTIQKDGPQTISVKVDDLAKNSATKSASITIDRIKPGTQIVAPVPTNPLPPNTDVIVQVHIKDQFSASVDVTGVDVVAKKLDGTFITRVSRRAFSAVGNDVNWSGRIRWRSDLPQEFKIVATAVDKAGNVATLQEIRVRVGNR